MNIYSNGWKHIKTPASWQLQRSDPGSWRWNFPWWSYLALHQSESSWRSPIPKRWRFVSGHEKPRLMAVARHRYFPGGISIRVVSPPGVSIFLFFGAIFVAPEKGAPTVEFMSWTPRLKKPGWNPCRKIKLSYSWNAEGPTRNATMWWGKLSPWEFWKKTNSGWKKKTKKNETHNTWSRWNFLGGAFKDFWLFFLVFVAILCMLFGHFVYLETLGIWLQLEHWFHSWIEKMRAGWEHNSLKPSPYDWPNVNRVLVNNEKTSWLLRLHW